MNQNFTAMRKYASHSFNWADVLERETTASMSSLYFQVNLVESTGVETMKKIAIISSLRNNKFIRNWN